MEQNRQGVLATMVAALLLALCPVSADAHGTGGGHGGGGHAGGRAGGGPVMNKPAEMGAATTEAGPAKAETGHDGHGWRCGCPHWDACLWGYNDLYYTPAYPMYDYDVLAAFDQLGEHPMGPRAPAYVPVSRFPPH